mmetsp:Transcript_16537/g.52729  ORF Transcript_16537/g.52729 Transcript_16537/m.52729 type:complete len:241 (-) Transcript_16537:887-1609(-)
MLTSSVRITLPEIEMIGIDASSTEPSSLTFTPVITVSMAVQSLLVCRLVWLRRKRAWRRDASSSSGVGPWRGRLEGRCLANSGEIVHGDWETVLFCATSDDAGGSCMAGASKSSKATPAPSLTLSVSVVSRLMSVSVRFMRSEPCAVSVPSPSTADMPRSSSWLWPCPWPCPPSPFALASRAVRTCRSTVCIAICRAISWISSSKSPSDCSFHIDSPAFRRDLLPARFAPRSLREVGESG